MFTDFSKENIIYFFRVKMSLHLFLSDVCVGRLAAGSLLRLFVCVLTL
jgi:hypothetical protein